MFNQSKKKWKRNIFLPLIIFSGIIFSGIIFIIITVCVMALDLEFEFTDVSIGSKTYKLMTDCMACHFYIAEYDTLNNQKKGYTYQSPFLESRETTQQGYGRYHIKANTNAFAFVQYCYDKNVVNFDDAVINGVIKAKSVNASTTIADYNSFMEKRAKTVATPDVEFFIYGFWQTLALAGESFNRLQDRFILERYVFPAARKLGLNTSNLEDEDGQEILTSLLTYVYTSMCNEVINESNISKVDKGDLIPFMYNKANADSPYELAKYAYIYLYYNLGTESNPYDELKMWGDEYGLVFNDDMDIDEEELTKLQQLADKANEKYKNQKADRENKLKGEKEDVIISSGYSVESKLNAIRTYTDELLAGVAIDADYRDLIDKNYLMVKHAMENQHIGDTIEDYCMGNVFLSEAKLSQGQYDEKNSKTAILSDFQVVDLKSKLADRFSTHSDDDGISDGEELGIQEEKDITAFIIKSNGGRAGLFNKAKNWAEFNEGISYTGTSDSDVIIKAKMWNYKSNPMLNDTDFDGLDDNVEKGKAPLINDFSGSTMTVDSDNYVLDLDFNQDFRYFLWNSDTYNDELCTMSLIMSNLAQNKRITIKQGTINYGSNLSIQSYMSKLGFNSIQSENISYDGITANVYIGYKTIDYYRKKRGVIGVFIGGLNNDKANDKMALTPENLIESNNYYNIIAEKIREKIDIDRLGETELFNCYWISGKGIAGGVAAELAYLYGTEEVYCYTFGSPYTHKGFSNPPAPYIKNIINEDDLLTKVISDETDFSRIGEIYNKSISMDLVKEYKAYIGVSSSSYKGDCSRINTMIRQIFKFIKGEPSTRDVLLSALSKNTGNGATSVIMSPLTTAVNDATIEISNTNDAQKDASSTKSYYVLSKVLEGINKSAGKDEKYNGINVNPTSGKETTDIDKEAMKLKEALNNIGKWYIENVYTYQQEPEYKNFVQVKSAEGTSLNVKGYKEYTIDGRKEYKKNSSDTNIRSDGNYDFLQSDLITGEKYNETTISINGVDTKCAYGRNGTNTGSFIGDIKISPKALEQAVKTNYSERYRNGTSLRYYKNCEHLKNKDTGTLYGYNQVGDDCVRSIFAVLEAFSEGKCSAEINVNGYSASDFYGDDSLKDKMKLLGFERYDAKDFDINNLIAGDILIARKGDKNEYQKSKGKSANTYNHVEIYESNDGRFSWGSVKESYPSPASYSKKKDVTDSSIEYIYDSNSNMNFIRVYHFVGVGNVE